MANDRAEPMQILALRVFGIGGECCRQQGNRKKNSKPEFHAAYTPPLMSSVAPVMKPSYSEAR